MSNEVLVKDTACFNIQQPWGIYYTRSRRMRTQEIILCHCDSVHVPRDAVYSYKYISTIRIIMGTEFNKVRRSGAGKLMRFVA